MPVSERATQLMRELDQFLAKLDAPIERIAAELGKEEGTNTSAVNLDSSFITTTLYSLEALRTDVARGPDAPADPDKVGLALPDKSWAEFIVRFNHVQMVLSRWSGVVSAINLQLRSMGSELYPATPPEDSRQAAIDAVTDSLFVHFHSFSNQMDQNEETKAMGGFADIPLSHSDFMRHMFAAHRITLAQRLGRAARFLDVGCGAGLKVLTAANFFEPSEGFDFDPGYVAAGQSVLEQTLPKKTHIFEADGLTFDAYDQYDVIYFYRPLSDNVKLEELEDWIVSKARPDALLIAPYTSFDLRFEELGCGRVAGRTYLAQSTAEEADALRRKAENMGLAGRSEGFEATGMWAPIENVLRKNGFQ